MANCGTRASLYPRGGAGGIKRRESTGDGSVVEDAFPPTTNLSSPLLPLVEPATLQPTSTPTLHPSCYISDSAAVAPSLSPRRLHDSAVAKRVSSSPPPRSSDSAAVFPSRPPSLLPVVGGEHLLATPLPRRLRDLWAVPSPTSPLTPSPVWSLGGPGRAPPRTPPPASPLATPEGRPATPGQYWGTPRPGGRRQPLSPPPASPEDTPASRPVTPGRHLATPPPPGTQPQHSQGSGGRPATPGSRPAAPSPSLGVWPLSPPVGM